MFYTSYFANLKNIPEKIVPVSICGKAPDWYNGLQFKKLAPKYNFFMEYKQDHDEEKYTKCFNEQVLFYLNANDIAIQLKKLAGTSDIALICYEKPGDFCHRHIVLNWLKENGIPCGGEYKFVDHLIYDKENVL